MDTERDGIPVGSLFYVTAREVQQAVDTALDEDPELVALTPGEFEELCGYIKDAFAESTAFEDVVVNAVWEFLDEVARRREWMD
jgi:hypothetical protein